jgi:hypothetical protein
MKRFAPISALLLAVACGAEPSMIAVDGELRAPDPRQPRVTVTPALDLSDASTRVGERFVVDELAVNLADVRILGEDPSIPPGGFALLSEPTLVYAEGEGTVGIELPFPPAFLDQSGLAIYLRSEPTEDLDQASIVVTGHWVTEDAMGAALTGVVDPDGEPVSPSDETGVVDPDGEPVLPEEDEEDGVVDPDGEPVRPEKGVVDPDGEPVHPRKSGVVDPDGEPVDCLEVDCTQTQQALRDGTRVVLREIGVVELVVSLRDRSRFDLVFGIPATRWIDEETSSRIIEEGAQRPEGVPSEARAPIVITSSVDDLTAAGRPSNDRDLSEQPAGGYYLADGVPLEDAITQGPGL